MKLQIKLTSYRCAAHCVCLPPRCSLVYPQVTNTAFEAFSCYSTDEAPKPWLRADVAIECWTEEHSDVILLASVAITIYPIGLLLVSAALLYSSRHAIQSGNPDSRSTMIAFLNREFKPHFFWCALCSGLAVGATHAAV